MPGKWIQRDPETGQIWQELSDEEMAARLRKSNPRSPEFVKHLPRDAVRLVYVNEKTVDVEIVGSEAPQTPFRWEFDLYEGWAEQGRTEPAPLKLTEPAWWAGMSVVDFIAASGATTEQARRRADAERIHALEVAEPLFVTFCLMTEASSLPEASADWYGERAVAVRVPLLAVLSRLTRGDAERAQELLTRVMKTREPLEDVYDILRKRWNVEDYHARFPLAPPVCTTCGEPVEDHTIFGKLLSGPDPAQRWHVHVVAESPSKVV